MALTIEDIAKLSGTSKSTVSRFLNDGSVSKKTKEKISAVIAETGFEFNVSASRLKRKKSNLIGILFEGFESVSVQKMLSGMNRSLKDEGYLPFIMLDEVDEEDRIRNVRALVNQGVDGIIYGAGQLTTEHIQYLAKTEVPVLVVGQENDYLPFIKLNDYEIGYTLGAHLSPSAYKKIAFVTRPETDRAIGIERRNGFIDGIKSDHDPDSLEVFHSSFDLESNYQLAPEILKGEPDLIVGATDRMIMGIIRYLNEQQIRIPEQVAVAGFGNYDYGEILSPSLTSVAIDYSALGSECGKKMIKLVEHEDFTTTTDYDYQVCLRGSTR